MNFGINFCNDVSNILYRGDNVWEDLLKINSNQIFFHRLIGINSNEETYLENYYNLMDKLNDIENKLIIKNGFGLSVDEQLLNKMNIYWVTVTKVKNITSRQIVDLTFRYMQEPLINKEEDELIKENLSNIISLFRESQDNLSILKNFYVKLVCWIEKYLPDLYKKENSSKVVFYFGDIKRDEAYFLLFLSWLGSNVLYLNTSNESGFKSINSIDKLSTLEQLENSKVYENLPKRPKKVKQSTIAHTASQELHEILHSGDSGIYKPWQFEEYEVKVVPLQTTYDEMIILWKEPANFRTGFSVENKTVHVPSMFSKVSGVYENIEKYWLDFEELRSESNTLFFDKVPFVSDVNYHKQNIILKDGIFDISDVKKMKEYKFHYLRLPIQNLIIDRINDLIELEDFFLFDTSKYEFKFKVLHTILQLDKRFIDQLQKFDFSSNIPKVVIYDKDESICSESDAIVLCFLHLIGFDIVLFTPTGYQNIENLINRIYFDDHKMPRFEMDLEIPNIQLRVNPNNSGDIKKASWFSKFFS